MFSPIAAGIALGGAFRGYNDQQQADQQRRALAMALEERQRQQQAKGLAFQALLSGALRNNQLPTGGFPMSSAPPVPQPSAPGGGGYVPQPPAPGQASVPAVDDSSFQTPAMRGDQAADPSSADFGTMGEADTPPWARSAAGATTMLPPIAMGDGDGAPRPTPRATTYQQPGESYRNLSPRADAPDTLDTAPTAPPATPSASSTSSPADPPPAAQQIVTQQTQGTPEQHSEIGQYLQQYLHTTPPSDLAEAVMKVKPDADPETAMLAVQELYKMSIQGTNLDKAIAAQIIGGLYKSGQLRLGQERVAQGGQRVAIAEQNAQTAAGGLAERQRHNQVTEGQGAERIALSKSRFDAGQIAKAEARASKAELDQMRSVNNQIHNANTRITQIMNQDSSRARDQALAQAQKDRDVLQKRYDDMVERLLGQSAQ